MSTKTPVIHPTNRVFPGTPDSPMRTLNEAFQDGMESGASWQDSDRFVPGGPAVSYLGAGYTAISDHSLRVRDEWLRGWHAGFQQLHMSNLPVWYIRRFPT